MQENVKVFTPEVLVNIFGNVNIKGDFTYKLHVGHINSRELSELVNVNKEYGMDFHISRSGKGLIIYCPTIIASEELSQTTEPIANKKRTIRDFFELDLPNQEARMAAFENTAKVRLDLEVNSLSEAILQSFYISDTKQGAEYWQDIMVNAI